MSRRINSDFDELNTFLSNYIIPTDSFPSTQIKSYKAMHKKLFGFLIFCGEFKIQKINQKQSAFLDEVSSDLLLAFFCVTQGMYKPAKLLLRCCIENYFKVLLLTHDEKVICDKSVFLIFDMAKEDIFSLTDYGTKCFDLLYNNYKILCRTVHGDPATMQPIKALAFLPKYNEMAHKEFTDIYIKTVETCLGFLYLKYPMIIDNMHPQNRKDFLDCLSKSTKGIIVNTLYSE